ncbi:DUF11 domain-containing protein [Lapillicoccus jejuensis]|uniref:Putative repeat protein (TIGR01451 family) n=1 Tax=Lapillicoccus jejuensis TaxID=402171 RepID=A0A542E4W9_9MICO|nr:DUF11 domain-containing protein [Lapillicoccus jejuensis]TQJ10326.1 putative repeat protein (TIGR01451 family) [Lapillicoccus jejuensis]
MRTRVAAPLVAAALLVGFGPTLTTAATAAAGPPKDDAPTLLVPKGEREDGSDEAGNAKLLDAYYYTDLLAGDEKLSLGQAAALREAATAKAGALPTATTAGAARGGAWTSVGPDPIVQVVRTSNTFAAMAGRVSALAIRKDGTILLGAAQGGVWTYDAAAGTWTSRTRDASTQSVGALALAPSDDRTVYLGTGEANLAGDSYYGDGIWRSSDGGVTWRHVSTLFTGQSVSAITVDPTNARHLYASTLRGRAGSHRTTAPTDQPYGVWESSDGGQNWTLRKGTRDEFAGATNLVMDPQAPSHLWASFWGHEIDASTDGGRTWAPAMSGLPDGQFLQGGTRFSLGISHPKGQAQPTLYTGFDWYDQAGTYHPSRVFKSVGGTSWTDATGSPQTGPDSVVGYCGTQCFYDNVLQPDPTNPDVVYALGLYGYNNSPQSGGIYRSTDGGATWLSLGYDLHPDYHAIAIEADDPSHVVIGNDGGVWQSHNKGGRHTGGPLSTATWENLNGTVDPATGTLLHSTGLAIGQFVSVATVPQVPGQYWGGTQDNGTMRKSLLNGRWFDQSSGDGGNVIVDQTTTNPLNPSAAAYVFGEYFGISPYRFDPSKVGTIFGNETIDGGIDTKDRAEFYVPWTQNRANPNQLFLGTYRLYRTDNAEAPSGGDVTWSPVSGDLTTGCTGAAPNGARGCLISAVGVADGGDGVWVGTDDAVVSVSPDAVTAAQPHWQRVGRAVLPNRPVNAIAVDRSNWRVAYLAYGGFSASTPKRTGHVFATTDGGLTFRDVTANLPDVPVDTIQIDPSDNRVIYVGTDVGAFVSTNGGTSYSRLGSGLPQVAVWQLDYDATNGVLLAGTHGRGAYTLANRGRSAALVVSTADAGVPVGPASTLDYTITVRNIGNGPASDVTITDPVPSGTTFRSADQGGRLTARGVVWSGLRIPAGGQKQVHLRVQVSPSLPRSVKAIVDDGVTVRTGDGVRTSGSPHTTPIAPPYDVAVTSTAQTGGARVGTSASYHVTVTNTGYRSDDYTVSGSGTWPTTAYDASCTTPLSATPTIAAGASTHVCVKVAVPATATDDQRDTESVTVTSAGASGAVGAGLSLTTIAVRSDTVLVDGDGNSPDTSGLYKAAMGGTPYGYWDLAADANLPQSYLLAHENVVWWTGNSYPGPVSPYEAELKALLDGGGRLFLSGQDILDQAAGTTSFVHDYLHVAWDGSETQNDKATVAVHGVPGNPVSGAAGTVVLDHSVLGANFEDQVTPIDPAAKAFTDDTGATDALTVSTGGYKVFFAAFPVEAYGTAADKATLVGNALTWFGQP